MVSEDPPSLSADGSVVAFESTAKNLVPGDTDEVSDVFVHKLAVPPARGFSVDYASAKEGGRRSATLRFTVTLAEERGSRDGGTVPHRGRLGDRHWRLRGPAGDAAVRPWPNLRDREVAVNDDDLAEGDETLSLELFRAEGTPIGEAVATGTILDDDD